MPPTLRQTAGAEIGAGQSYECAVTLTQPTLANNLLVVTAIAASYYSPTLTGPDGFTLIRTRTIGLITLSMWYFEGAPATSTIKVRTNQVASMQVKLVEYSGAAVSGSLDKVAVSTNAYAQLVSTGSTGVITQADSIVVAAVANQYASTVQQGFSGALTRLLESVSPQIWGGYRVDTDDLRTRLTMHQAITSAVQNFTLDAILTAFRPWIAIICTFRGGSSGPVRMVSSGTALAITGKGDLTVFGKLVSANLVSGGSPALTVSGGLARIGPFTHQYRLGGWDGLLVGEGTDYRVESVEGLGGMEMRTSDDDLPRGDGAIRGTDLQSARLITFKVNADDPDEAVVEERLDVLYRALVPQRDADWPLIWRDAGQMLKLVYCRPTNLVRSLDWQQLLMLDQTFVLRAADPRHYSASRQSAKVPNTPAGSAVPYLLSVVNAGNGFAFPVIRVVPTSVPISRVELRNYTYDISFVVEATIPVNSALVGDMEARSTGAPRSPITIDGQSKYGAWGQPRVPWRLAPGLNDLAVTTVPAGAPVQVTVEYSHTWSS